MCGIAGFVNRDGDVADRELLARTVRREPEELVQKGLGRGHVPSLEGRDVGTRAGWVPT